MSLRVRPVAARRADLRQEWAARSTGNGWAFPSDWRVAAVDAVCEALAGGLDSWPAAERLGRERAAAGVSLGEALADIDHLAGLVRSAELEVLRRAVSLGWADRIVTPAGAVCDPLTGLASAEYLQTRLGEVYREAAVHGGNVAETSVLVMVRLDDVAHTSWRRMSAMVVLAEAMRTVFDAGQTLAMLGEGTAAVLTRRGSVVARQARLLAVLLQDRLAREGLAGSSPRVWLEDLPGRHDSVRGLLEHLGR